MDHVAVRYVVLDLQVRDFECTYRIDRAGQATFGFTVTRHPQPLPRRAQYAQDLRAIKTLTLTVVAKAHRSSPVSASSLSSCYTSIFVFQSSSFTSAL